MSGQQMTILQAAELARAHLQAGQLREAELICRQILAAQPDHAEALHLLGAVAFQVGKFDSALDLFASAIKHNSGDPTYHCNYGQTLAHLGKLDEAIAAYRNALRVRPDFSTAHNMLGDALDSQGNTEEAIAAYQQAIAANPNYAEAHNNLGVVLLRTGAYDQAEASFAKALSIRPEFPQALNNLGECCRITDRLGEATAAFQQAIRLAPSFGQAFHNLGLALCEQGQIDQAIAALQQAAALMPDFADVHHNLGIAYLRQQSFDRAADAFNKALALKPELPEALNNLGNALHAMKKTSEAIDAYRRAIALRADFANAYHNLGIALAYAGNPQEAVEAQDNAIRLRPDFAEAHNNRGSALHTLGRFDEAIESFQKAIALKPDYILAHHNLSLTLLLLGRFEQAWPEHEWRCREPGEARVTKNFKQPKWDGSDPAGQRMLLYVEQGFGDTLHFIRYVPLLAERGTKVIVGCRPQMLRILKSVKGIDRLIVDGDPLPDFDIHCSLLSLPYLFGQNSAESFPANIPYIHAEPELSSHWQERIASLGAGSTIGLVWAGGPAHANNRTRSMRLDLFAPLAKVSGIQFISLQKGDAAAQAKNPPADLNLIDFSNELEDFAHTAALIENLDLVLTVDTSVAHLAGAMSKPVWVMLPFIPDWRWMLDRKSSSWYPTMRLFRQESPGDWSAVINHIVAELPKMIQGRRIF